MSKSWYINQFVLKTFELSKDLKLILYMNFNQQLRAELLQNSSLFTEFDQDRIIIDTRPRLNKILSKLFVGCFTGLCSNESTPELPKMHFDYKEFIKSDAYEVNLIKFSDNGAPYLTITNNHYL